MTAKLVIVWTMLALAAACTWKGHGCDEGIPRNFKPQVLVGADGKRYFVAHHVGCVFSVVEVPAETGRDKLRASDDLFQ